MLGAVVDLETTSLSAVGAGMIVCAVIKPLQEDAEVLRYDYLNCKPGKEKKLVQEIVTRLENFHLLIGHNILSFDWGFLKSRAVSLGVPFKHFPLAYDTMRAFKRTGLRTRLNQIGKPTAALDHIIDFFGLPQEKTRLYPVEHWKTIWETGDDRTKAVQALVDHCVADVEMTEKIYWKLLDLDTTVGFQRLK